jgi:hypothetical protein
VQCHASTTVPTDVINEDRSASSRSATGHADAKGASALEGVSGQRHAPAALYPQGKDPPVPSG